MRKRRKIDPFSALMLIAQAKHVRITPVALFGTAEGNTRRWKFMTVSILPALPRCRATLSRNKPGHVLHHRFV